MKRIIISTILFFFILGFAVIYNNKLIRFCDNALAFSDEIEILIKEKDWNKSYEKSLELKELMSKNFSSISIYINHQDIDILNTEILKLIQYMEEEDSSEGLASLYSVKSYTEYIKELQEVSIMNIL